MQKGISYTVAPYTNSSGVRMVKFGINLLPRYCSSGEEGNLCWGGLFERLDCEIEGTMGIKNLNHQGQILSTLQNYKLSQKNGTS